MNWETVLTTIWNEIIRKPFTCILVGAAFISAASEDDIILFGRIFIAAGVGIFMDNFTDKLNQIIPKKWSQLKEKKEIKREIENTTNTESGLLKIMVERNKRIMRRSDFENIFSYNNQRNRNKLPLDIYDIFESLRDKNLIYYHVNEYSGYFDIEITNQVWDILKVIYKNDFNNAHKSGK